MLKYLYKYPSLGFWVNCFGGHISFLNITIFGANAMDWVLEIRTKRFGTIVITLPSLTRIKKDRYGKRYLQWHIYASPNSTPWACTFYIGNNKEEQIRSKIRKLNFGHNFNSELEYPKLKALNDKFYYLTISEYDIEKYNK